MFLGEDAIVIIAPRMALVLLVNNASDSHVYAYIGEACVCTRAHVKEEVIGRCSPICASTAQSVRVRLCVYVRLYSMR